MEYLIPKSGAKRSGLVDHEAKHGAFGPVASNNWIVKMFKRKPGKRGWVSVITKDGSLKHCIDVHILEQYDLEHKDEKILLWNDEATAYNINPDVAFGVSDAGEIFRD